MKKIYCCGCGEDTEFDKGRMVWESEIEDGKMGHKYCIETYDKALKETIAKEDLYSPPKCEKCGTDLLLSRTVNKETGFRINEYGEVLKYPITLYGYSGNLVERLCCERCHSYYEVERDSKERLIVGGKIK